jgi:hypothetical protein
MPTKAAWPNEVRPAIPVKSTKPEGHQARDADEVQLGDPEFADRRQRQDRERQDGVMTAMRPGSRNRLMLHLRHGGARSTATARPAGWP